MLSVVRFLAPLGNIQDKREDAITFSNLFSSATHVPFFSDTIPLLQQNPFSSRLFSLFYWIFQSRWWKKSVIFATFCDNLLRCNSFLLFFSLLLVSLVKKFVNFATFCHSFAFPPISLISSCFRSARKLDLLISENAIKFAVGISEKNSFP